MFPPENFLAVEKPPVVGPRRVSGLAGPENPKDFWAVYGTGFIPVGIKTVFKQPLKTAAPIAVCPRDGKKGEGE